MPEETEAVVPETTEEVLEETTEAAPEVEAEPEVDWKAEAEKNEKLAASFKVRAEMAEKAAKRAKEVAVPVKYEGLSPSDLLAVMKANIHEDDMDRVERFAKSEGMTIKEALGNEEMKAILSLRVEQRNTAGAANVSNVRRAPAKVSEDALIANASIGKLPDNDYDINRLIAAKARQK